MPYRPGMDRWHEGDDAVTERRSGTKRVVGRGLEHSQYSQNTPDNGRRDLSRMMVAGIEGGDEDVVPAPMSWRAWTVIRQLSCSFRVLQGARSSLPRVRNLTALVE